jgi:NAD(P)H-dependent FMN reductase
MKITIISGSPRLESTTFRVAAYLQKYFPAHYAAHEFTLVDVRDYPLPFVQNVFGSVAETQPQWKPLAEIMFSSDAFVLVTPEYNGGYSPAMKNLLDHFPKQMKKVFGMATASPGAMGGMRAAQQMQQMVCAFFGIPCPNMLLVPAVDKKFNLQNELTDAEFEKGIAAFAKEFIWLAEAVHQKKNG